VQDLWIAFGLVLVIEGALYALFPQHMIDLMRRLPSIPPAVLRLMGLTAVGLGWLIVWLLRGSS
jgi:uncharacterized protein YjeT (DUF2065 family)